MARYAPFFIALLLVVLTTISALSPATALREDFLAFSPQKSIAVCGCSIRANTLTVKNTGDVTSVYSLAQSGSAASWSTLSETGFTLKPGEAKDIAQFIRAPCSAEGTADIETTITTLFQASKKITQKVTVPLCSNILAAPVRSAAVSCPAQPMQFQVTLANPLSYPEVYELRVEPAELALKNADKSLVEKSVSISERAVLLAPRQKKNVLVFFHTPSNVYGTATLNLVITTRNSGLETAIPLKAAINQCYGFSLAMPSPISFCTEFENRLPLELTNNALVSNTYALEAGILTPEGDVAEGFDVGEQSLPPKTSQQLFADLLVEAGPGDYLFGVEARTEIGDLAQYAEAPLAVTYCDDSGNPLTPEEYEELLAALEPAEPVELVELANQIEPVEPAAPEEPIEPEEMAEPTGTEEAETEEETPEETMPETISADETGEQAPEEAGEEPEEAGEEPEETAIPLLLIAIPLFLFLLFPLIMLLAVAAARARTKKKKGFVITPYESVVTEEKTVTPPAARAAKHKAHPAHRVLLPGVLAVFFVLLLAGSLFMVASLFPAPEEDVDSGISGEENITAEDAAEPDEPGVPDEPGKPEELPDGAEEVAEAEEPESDETDESDETEETEETGEEESTEEISETAASSALISAALIAVFAIIGVFIALLAHRIRTRRARTLSEGAMIYDLASDKKKTDTGPVTLQSRIRDVSKRAEKSPFTAKKRKKRFLIFGVILLAVLLGIGALLLPSLLPARQNLIVSVDHSDSFADPEKGIFVDGISLRVPAGAAVDIPLIFRNIDDGTPRTAHMDFGIGWLKPDADTLSLEPDRETKAVLSVAETAPAGRYTLLIDITNENSELFTTDEILLTIGKQSALLTLLYATAGLIVLLIFVFIIFVLARRFRKKPAIEIIDDGHSPLEQLNRAQKKLREAAAKAAAEEAVRNAAEKAEQRAARKKKLKKYGTYAGALILVLLLTWGVFSLSRYYMFTLEPPRAEPVEITTEEPAAYELSAAGPVSVPIKIINKNPSFAYNITAESGASWISFNQPSILVQAGSAEIISMLLAPDARVDDGTYTLNVKIEEQSERPERTLFTSTILVKLSKRGFLSTLKLYWLYILFGVLILAALIVLLACEARRRHRAMLGELAIEAKKKAAKKATKKPASKKSKYRLPPTRLSIK